MEYINVLILSHAPGLHLQLRLIPAKPGIGKARLNVAKTNLREMYFYTARYILLMIVKCAATRLTSVALILLIRLSKIVGTISASSLPLAISKSLSEFSDQPC